MSWTLSYKWNVKSRKKPTFYDTVTYSNEDGLGGLENIIGDRSEIYLAGEPEKVDKLEFPKSNEKLKDWAKEMGWFFKGELAYIYMWKMEEEKLRLKMVFLVKYKYLILKNLYKTWSYIC